MKALLLPFHPLEDRWSVRLKWYYLNVLPVGASSVTVSAKISKKLKESLAKHGVRVSEVVRNALQEEVTRREEIELREALHRLSRNLKGKVSTQDVVAAVRSTREER